MQQDNPQFQQHFMAYLQGEDATRLAPWLPSDPEQWRRLQVYRNSSMKASVQALVDNFPVCHSVLVGNQFRQLARDHVLQHRPEHAILAWYGQQLPNWLEAQLSRHQCPWLSDLARLERGWLNAVLAEDLAAISADDIAQLAGEGMDIQTLQLSLQPSVQLLENRFDVWELWLQQREELNAAHAPVFMQPSRRMIWRQPNHELQYRVLSAAEWAFLAALYRQPTSLQHAALEAMQVDADFDISASFASLLSQGLLCRVSAHKGVL